MINHTGFYHWLSDLELMAMLFAAAIHDAEHTGTTNAFHVSIQSNLAKLYKVLGFKFYPAEIPKWTMNQNFVASKFSENY